MKFKQILLIMLLLLAVFTISVVSATDNGANDTGVISANDDKIVNAENDFNVLSANDNQVSKQSNDENLGTQNFTEVLRTNQGYYSELANEIGTKKNVELKHAYYTYDSGSVITISKTNAVINGNGAIIDMAGSSIGAFYVSASGVTIKNLTIKNANYDGYDGVIHFESTGTVTNCNFVNDSASSKGGAVYFYDEGTVTNCNFTGNSAYRGGAVYFYQGTGSVTNCNFVNNTATDGSAVYFYEKGTVENCNFVNNTASSSGAISIYLGTIRNCKFTNNKASNDGSAVHIMDSGTVINCNFVNNTARDGGAVNIAGGTVTNCNFTNNTASSGGAINIYSGTVRNCKFTNNKASNYGGAVYITDSGTVINCKFTNNKASNDGGAVYINKVIFYGDAKVTNCNFVNNTASSGGAIYMYLCIVENCKFTNNKASNDGGAVYFNKRGTVTNCKFVNNTATNGGAAYFNQKGTVEKCKFTNNKASNDGGAVYVYKDVVISISNSKFVNNVAKELGGAVYFNKLSKVNNCIFKGNSEPGVYPINVLKPKIIASNFDKDYSSKKKYKVRIKDSYGNYVGAGKKVTFVLYRYLYTENNKDKTVKLTTKSVKTDKNGYATVDFNVASDSYKVKIKYGATTVNKYYYVESLINSKNIFKTAKKIVIPISLKKVDGKYLKGKKIKITFYRELIYENGKTHLKAIKSYTKKTNSKGAVKFTFNKSPIKISSNDRGLGFTVIISYAKDKAYAAYTQYTKNPFKYHWQFF